MSNGHTKILNFQAQKLIEFSAADVRSLSTRREGSISISLKMSENVLWSFNSVQIGMLRVGPFSSGVAEVRRKSRAIFGLENVSFCTPLWKLYRVISEVWTNGNSQFEFEEFDNWSKSLLMFEDIICILTICNLVSIYEHFHCSVFFLLRNSEPTVGHPSPNFC